MTQWYVKDLSKLTQVSVQTLHHYDRIDLLKPSLRLPNGYRLYSESDLLKLQQILALKFFGFDLSKIKTLLSENVDVIDHLTAQSRFLEDKAKAMLETSQVLKNIIAECNIDKSIPWESLIKLIEVYRMTQEIENSWITKVLNPEELKEYVSFEQNLKNRFTANEKQQFENEWANIAAEVAKNINQDPSGKLGFAIGKRCMDWVNAVYGSHVELRNAVWEKGFKGVDYGNEHALSPEGVAWMDKAIDTYYRTRITNILSQIGHEPDKKVATLWEGLLQDMCGSSQVERDKIIQAVLEDSNTSEAMKRWIRKFPPLKKEG